MHIALVISSLDCGGTERVLTTMANFWAEAGQRITIVTLAKLSDSAYPLHSSIDRIGLGATGDSRDFVHGLRQNLGRLAKLRKILQNAAPDIVISFMNRTNVSVLLATAGLKIPVVVTEHCDPAQARLNSAWRCLRRVAYPLASALVSVSCGVDAHFSWLPAHKRRVIYNPIPVLDFASDPQDPRVDMEPGKKYLVGMGRLIGEKGFDLFIQAFSKLADRYPNWDAIILGEGAQRQALTQLAENCGLDARVLMPGRFKNPFSILEQCDLFVLSSRSEGFPCALIEAMACGLPAVAFACPHGPEEIVRHGEDGLLVPPQDIDALAAALERLIVDENRRREMAERARQNMDRFRLEAIMNEWDALIAEKTDGCTIAA
jgi:glycosyltransferase involved in cell wall biosynthesis